MPSMSSGQVVGADASGINVDSTVLAVAKGKSAAVYRTVSIGLNNYREYVEPLPLTVSLCQTEVPFSAQ